ncbi:uncharacterized protein L3040_008354 [Drepanopeziza brunnea f. sp. 'multigermtubi']|uniref:uncharacterized protein n=1 Tax=Drepanopeziza brunnea f. sp. 'multigermtubi' TaxID=698441 RepID=UPI00239B2671|nr:hypothetical protein L3040_008354 [Drepanopeziza brunnea f. sp. 'multigermtubi']
MAGGHDPIPQKVDPKGTNARNILEPSTGTEIPEKEERTDESLDESLEEGTTSRKNESLTAGLQVVGAFFMMFNSWGIANTFGAYQNYYENALLRDETPSRISWIGSIQGFLLILVGGLFTGPIFDTGHLRGLGICTSIDSALEAKNSLFGNTHFGPGEFFPQYFTERRALAAGLAAAGSSLGGVIHPIVFHELQPRIGFRWATRVIAFIMLATLTIPLAVMRAKVFPSTRRPLFDFQVLRNIPYILFTIGEFFGFMGLYVPFYYITTYSTEKKIAGPNLSFYLLTLINTGSILGRIVPNFFADLTGPLNICTPFVLLCGLIAFCWPSIASLGQAVTFCLAYGFFSGTFVSITGPSIATLSTDLGLVGTHMGMSFAFASLGLLVGNPVAGVLLRGRGWLGPAMFCGATNLLAGLFILGARLAKTGKVLVVQA